MQAGIIVMLGEYAYLNSAPALAQFVEGFRGGMAFGLMGGLLAGMAGSLALSIWRGRQERSKKGPWKEALNIPRRIPEDLFSE
jgi:hypothetical protein